MAAEPDKASPSDLTDVKIARANPLSLKPERLGQIKSALEANTFQMQDNLLQVMNRGEIIGDLQEKSKDLEEITLQFKEKASAMKGKKCWELCTFVSDSIGVSYIKSILFSSCFLGRPRMIIGSLICAAITIFAIAIWASVKNNS